MAWNPKVPATVRHWPQSFITSHSGHNFIPSFTKIPVSNTPFVTYLLTSQNRVLLEELTGSPLVKKFPAFNGTRRFIRSMTPSHFLKIHINIILPPTPRSSKWTLSLTFPSQNPVCISPLHPYVLHAPKTSFFSI